MYRQIRKATAKTRPRRFAETGQGLVEYAIIIALVAILAIGATSFLGGRVKGTLSGVGGSVNGAVLGANQGGPTPAPTPVATPTPTATPQHQHSAQHYTSDHDSSGCVADHYYWIDPPGNNNSYCSEQPAPTPAPTPTPHPASYYNNDESGCRSHGYDWHDAQGYRDHDGHWHETQGSYCTP